MRKTLDILVTLCWQYVVMYAIKYNYRGAYESFILSEHENSISSNIFEYYFQIKNAWII